MKKFLPILFSLALLAHQAQAANSVFVGVDMLQTTAKHTSAAGPTSVGPSVTTYTDPDNSSRRSSDLGLGFNAGLRFDPARFHVANNLYLSGEVFFEELNSSAKGYDQIVTGAGPKSALIIATALALMRGLKFYRTLLLSYLGAWLARNIVLAPPAIILHRFMA